MIFRLFRRSDNQAVIQRLYAAVVAAARHPALFASFGVPDTVEGRFDSLTLHAALVLSRLNAMPAPGPDVAQDLVDAVFRHLDGALREMGVGDTVVPKRMKSLVEAFLGRSAAYDEALRRDGETSGEVLALALARNVLVAGPGDTGAAYAAALARYVAAASIALASAPLEAFLAGRLAFPDPARFVPETVG